MTDSTLNYGWEIWTLLYKLQKKLYRIAMDIWRRAARTFRLLKVRNELEEKMGVTQTILERLENMLKW
jgi:hypothetical protein